MERKIKAKMIEVFNNNFIDDTITSNNSLSNAWNCMFMTVNESYCLSRSEIFQKYLIKPDIK